jgi:cyclopropane-fatty-acyl-phospholipid synthase
MMSAALQQVEVSHVRLSPVRHDFLYSQLLHVLPLKSLPSLESKSVWWGYNKLRPLSLYDEDYLSRGSAPLYSKLLNLLLARGHAKPIQEVLLLTTPRYFGVRVFTPVSFYFCYGQDDALVYLVVEINNTFYERYVYVIEATRGERGEYSAELRKDFHVSPFFTLDFDYRFRFFDIREKVDISIELLREDKLVFSSRVRAAGDGIPLTGAAHRSAILRAPLQPLLTTPRIYWQALQLFFRRRIPVLQKPNPSLPGTVRAEPVSVLDRACMWFVKRFLKGISQGALEVVLPDGDREVFGNPSSGPIVRFEIRSFKLFRRLVLDGGLGLGEGYIEGDWNTPDLSAVLKLLLNNWHAIDEGRLHFFKPLRLIHLLFHKLRSNTVTGSKKNIEAHYDLSNDFFKLFLDESMTYSCGYYESQQVTLEESQKKKISKILEKAELESSDHVLEVGSGWGSLALTAAAQSGCRVTSVTVSEEQCKLATQRAAEASLSDKVKFVLKDYRHIEGTFDKIVSVEMLEAVGHEHLPAFFSMCERALAPGGLVVLQVITMPDQYYHAYRQRLDFIQKYVFPGSHLPSLSAINQAMTDYSSLVIESMENIGPHYARTLSEWRTTFEASKDKLKSLGYDDRFQRIWQYYFASCEAEFATRWIGVQQIVLTRPNNPLLIRKDGKTIYQDNH